MSDRFNISFNSLFKNTDRLFTHKIHLQERTPVNLKSNQPLKADSISIDPANQYAMEDIVVPIQSSDDSSRKTAVIQNIRRDSMNSKKAIGELNLNPLGLGTHKIELSQNQNGDWISSDSIRTSATKINDTELTMDIGVTAEGLEIKLSGDSQNPTIQNTVQSLNALFETDIEVGMKALRVIRQLQNRDEESITGFLSGLDLVASKTSDSTGDEIKNYLDLIGQHTSKTPEIANRIANLEGSQIGDFLSASVHSGRNLDSLLGYLDSFQQEGGFDFLDTAAKSQDRLESLLTQMNRFKNGYINDFASVFSNLSPESIGLFSEQLERADKKQIEDILASSVASRESADSYLQQLRRMNDEQYDAFIDLSSKAGEEIGALSKQFERVDTDSLDSMINLTQTAQANGQQSLFLTQMERVSDEDVQSFTNALEQSRDGFNDFLFQMQRVQDGDISDFIEVGSNMGDLLPDFLNQMKRIDGVDLHHIIRGLKNVVSENYRTVLDGMKRLNDSNLLPFLSYLEKDKTDKKTLSKMLNPESDINQIDWHSIRA